MKTRSFNAIKGFLACLFFLPAVAWSQGELYENFNRSSLVDNFPPYGWRQIDADGDGAGWLISTDGVDGTMAMTSYISTFGQQYKPDNWMITSALSVKSEQDTFSYWVGSYLARSNYLEIWVSRGEPVLEDFTERIDSVTFDGTGETDNRGYQSYVRSIGLKEFVGDTIWVAFRYLYKPELPNIDNTIGIAVDNVSGPEVVPMQTEIGVEGVLVSDGVSEPCDITDQPVTVIVGNYGTNAVSSFTVSCQSYGLMTDTTASMSPIITERVERTLAPGDTLHYTFEESLPFGDYLNGVRSEVMVRAFIGLESDEYPVNDTAIISFYKQNSFKLPMQVGFESDRDADPDYQYWDISYRPESQSMAPFSVGQNPKFAYEGNNYLTCGIYPPSSGAPTNGEDCFAATRCLLLEEGMDYRVDMFYGFRKLAEDWPQGLHFRLILGKDQADLINQPYTVVLDTFLQKNGELITPELANYSFFSSSDFSVEKTGTYYMGLVFYGDSLVKDYTDSWMIFVDNFSLVGSEQVLPVDLSLEQMVLPYDCNLTDAEPVQFIIRNTSGTAVSDISVSYTINNGDAVRETVKDTVHPNESFVYTFEQLADVSDFGRYRVDGNISHPLDSSLANNTLTSVAVNSEPQSLPYADDFEEYSTLLVFEDEWRSVYQTGYYTWMAAFDYTEDTAYAYNGVGFMADANANEQYVGQNDWVLSKCFNFQKDSVYEISFMYRIEQEGTAKASLHAYIMAAYDTVSKLMDVAHLQDVRNVDYQECTMQFTAEEDFVGHLGLHSQGEVGAPILMLDAVRIASPKEDAANECLDNAELSVYPNPASDVFHVRASFPMSSVSVYSISGVLQKKVACASEECTLNVSGWDDGVYLVAVEDTYGRIHVSKLVIGL